MSSTIAVIDGTFEALLTLIHMYYYEKFRPADVLDGSLPSFQQTLDADYLHIEADHALAETVYKAMRQKLSGDTLHRCVNATLNYEDDKFFDIFKYIILAFKEPNGVDDREQLDFIRRTRKRAAAVGKEAHKLTGFARFRETSDGILYCDISPKHNTLAMVCDHFTDRLGSEKWIIHDIGRGLAGVYDGDECVITAAPKGAVAVIEENPNEEEWQELWTAFYKTLAIQERRNQKLRTQMSPKYFWKHMTEHQRRKHWE